MSILVILAALLAVAPAMAHSAAESPQLFCEFEGTQVEDTPGSGLRGPESFAVRERSGEVLILDSGTRRIITLHRGKVRDSMLLPTKGRALDLAELENGDLVVIDDTPAVYRARSDSGVVQEILRPNISADSVLGFAQASDAAVELATRTGSAWSPEHALRGLPVGRERIGLRVEPRRGLVTDPEGRVLVTLPFSGVHGALSYVGDGGDGTFYVAVEDVLDVNEGSIAVDLCIKRLSLSGEEVGSLTIPLTNYASMPQRYARVGSSGLLYIMVVSANGLRIYRTDLVGDQTLPPEPSSVAVITSTELGAPSAVVPMSISVPDRATVRNRADAIINYQWTFHTFNGDWQRAYVTAPQQFSSPPPNGSSQIGIPYCWGGFDGVDKSSEPSKWANYSAAMSYGAEAGNINTSTGYHQPNTAGVDCSGFVSAALNLPTHYGPSLYGASNLISGASLQSMDILIRVGSHVVFFVSEDSSGNVLTKESTIDGSPDAAKNYTRTWSSLAVGGYEPRSFWSGTSSTGTSFDTAVVLGDPYSYRVGGYVATGTSKYYMTYVMRGSTYTVSVAPQTGNPDLAIYDNNRVFVGASSGSSGTDSVTFVAASSSFYYVVVTGTSASRYYLSQN